MTPRDRIALIGAVVLVALAGVWFGVVGPRRADADTARQELAQARDRVAAARAAVIAPKAPADAQDAMAVAASLGKALPTDDNTTSLGIQLQDLATRSHVTFGGLSLASAGAPGAAPTESASAAPAAPAATTTTPAATPDAPAPAAAGTADGATPPGTSVDADGYTTLPLDLTFSGSYLDVQGLLGRIDALVRVERGGHIEVRGRLLSISAISLSPRAGDRGRVDVTARAVAYLAPEDLALVPDVTAAGTALTSSPASAPAPDASTPNGTSIG